jgi:hypothetical protein
MPNIARIGDLIIPVAFDRMVELTNEKRRLRGYSLLPQEITQDNLKITWNSEEFRDDFINVGFLGHLQHDILVPYPGNAWMGSIFPEQVFTEIHSINYYQKINGDCELTHAMEDLYRILKSNGTAHISVPNFNLILNKIVQTNVDTERLKWEHFLFSRNVDEKGLYYNQSLCTHQRLYSRAIYAGFKSISKDEFDDKDIEKCLNMKPDQFDLPGVNEEARKNFQLALMDSAVRRKKCIVPRCISKAGQQEHKREQSVYCRRHYRKAKAKLIETQEKILRTTIILKKE